MASVTYTFANGTTASATEVNQNFTDLVNEFNATTGHDHDGTDAKKITLTTGATGTLPIANGGTGAVTLGGANILLSTDTRFETGTFTRDISTTGSQEVNLSGAFQPKALLFLCSFTSYGMSFGAYDGTTASFGYAVGTTPTYSYGGTYCVVISDGTNTAYATPNSLDSDGFTVTWTKANSPTGTATITYIAYK